MLRKFALPALFLVFAGLTLPSLVSAAGKTHDISTEVVSVDVKARTITIKDEKGQDMTAAVMESALEDLKKVKTGDKVIVTCQDNEKGEHVAVSAIKPAKV